MIELLVKLLISTLSLLAVAYLIPGIELVSFYIALIVALLFAVINVTLKPILLILTLPINIVTFGLFTFLVNGILFYFVASFVEGFVVNTFWLAVVGALIVSIFTWIGDKVLVR